MELDPHDLNRLASALPATGVYSGQSQRLCLAYDSFGNRTQANFQTTPCSSSDPATATYSTNNRLNTTSAGVLVYDNAGNTTFDGQNYYAYDGDGRLCAVQTSPCSGGTVAYGYIYDAEGRRVAKGTITVTSTPLAQSAADGGAYGDPDDRRGAGGGI